MKVFFDTNVLVAAALLGGETERMLDATVDAKWRIYTSNYVLDELVRALTEKLNCSHRLALLTRRRILRQATIVEPESSRHVVAADRADDFILQCALTAGVDYLVTNDRHLLARRRIKASNLCRLAGTTRCSSSKES